MKNMFVAAGSLAFLLSSLFAVSAQGVPRGAAQGAAEGNAAAGPVGAVVGGVVGGVTGGVKGLLGIDQRPRFHEYVGRQHHPSYNYRDSLAVGTVLPGGEIAYCALGSA